MARCFPSNTYVGGKHPQDMSFAAEIAHLVKTNYHPNAPVPTRFLDPRPLPTHCPVDGLDNRRGGCQGGGGGGIGNPMLNAAHTGNGAAPMAYGPTDKWPYDLQFLHGLAGRAPRS